MDIWSSDGVMKKYVGKAREREEIQAAACEGAVFAVRPLAFQRRDEEVGRAREREEREAVA